MKNTYNLKKDILFLNEYLQKSLDDLSKEMLLSKRSIQYALKDNYSNNTLEKIYSYMYNQGIRLSIAKSEVFLENLNDNELLFFHGSKYGFDEIDYLGSRSDSDFSNGFYCSTKLDSAISFVEDIPSSSVYVYKANISKVKFYEFKCDLEWMIAISYFRNKLYEYKDSKYVKDIVKKTKGVDVVIAPIADNKMFEVLNQFANGEITSTQALHSLSASRLGKQYVFKTKKAISQLQFLDRFYLCEKERNASKLSSFDNSNIIQTKLDLAKREYRRQGQYIDEILK